MYGFIDVWIYVFVRGCICGNVGKHKHIMLIISPIRRLP